MPNPVINVTRLSKLYHLGLAKPNTLRESLERRPRKPLISHSRDMKEFQAGPLPDTFWALKDISFEIRQGEVVGIVGKNGSGKSTLLKILSRITEPTSGKAVLRGRAASLLEIGTGFHPDLTGRENVYLNGAMLGMRKREIDKKLDAILAFSEIEEFIDAPVKHYSSGMYIRLAFSVAAHLDPEILLIDEVLAVGDFGFQKKCIEKIREIIRNGATALFVSHNLTVLSGLAQRTLLISGGRIEMEEETGKVIRAYLKPEYALHAEWKNEEEDAGKRAVLLSAQVSKNTGEKFFRFNADESFRIEIGFKIKTAASLQVAFRLNRFGEGSTVLTSALSDLEKKPATFFQPGIYTGICHIPANYLMPGTYCLLMALNDPVSRTPVDLVDSVLLFEITTEGSPVLHDNRLGSIAPVLPWELKVKE